jgi:ribonuclease P protein component
LVVLVAQASESAHTRVGVAAGKTTGSAVHRNRAKRLLREAIRPMLAALAPRWDLILIARPALSSATLEQASQALSALLQRAKLIAIDES